MKKLLLILATVSLMGCATAHQGTVISGNGGCHPSQDLTAHKTMKKVPEQETPVEDLWALFASERKDHRADINDYNSLYNQCVDKVKTN